jgi:mannose/fructose/N-acetylgalactosamine-specific phosphotransferase system component IIC
MFYFELGVVWYLSGVVSALVTTIVVNKHGELKPTLIVGGLLHVLYLGCFGPIIVVLSVIAVASVIGSVVHEKIKNLGILDKTLIK